MANHVIECSEPWFSAIRKGTKPVEGRKNTERWAKIAVGDILTFKERDAKGVLTSNKFDTKVTRIVKYLKPDALGKYLEGETIAKALPGVATMAEARAVYLQWSTEKEIEDSGAMLGLHVEVITEGLPLPKA
jgi:ASC-1-like (ASCH) protein